MISDPCRNLQWIDRFLNENDFSANTRRAFGQDLGKFTTWFTQANKEPFRIGRVTTGDVSSFQGSPAPRAAASRGTVNRALVTVRRFFAWLIEEGQVTANPAKKVKELRRQQLAPKGLERSQVRKLLREVELRGDIRASCHLSPVPVHRLLGSAIWSLWNSAT